MPFLIDGDNLLGTWRGRSRNDAERLKLAAQVARGLRGRRAVVVFDGAAPNAAGFAGEVHFSGPGRTADDLMLALLGRETDRRGWIVVTSDRSLGDRCRHLGARIERCDRFRGRLAGAPDGEKPERVEDVEDWLAAFGEPLSEASPPSHHRRPRGPGRDGER